MRLPTFFLDWTSLVNATYPRLKASLSFEQVLRVLQTAPRTLAIDAQVDDALRMSVDVPNHIARTYPPVDDDT